MVAERVSLELDSLPLDQIRRVNLLADRFEESLRKGLTPSPESFIAELEHPAARLVLLRLLMLTEQELSPQALRTEIHGEAPTKLFSDEPPVNRGEIGREPIGESPVMSL